jgi:uncharacterized protein YndB with AHSA1/START domain
MTLTETTDLAQSDTLSFQIDLPHPPERVWRALTDPALLAKWLLPVIDFRTDAGTRFKFAAPPQPGWDGTVDCRMIECEPQRKLRYAWVVGDIDTIVTFTIAPAAAHTRLTVVQSGFKPTQPHNFGGARYGWNMMGTQLIELLEREAAISDKS